MTGAKPVQNGSNVEKVEPVVTVMRNKAGQIFLASMDGNHFDMSKYIGETLYIIREK